MAENWNGVKVRTDLLKIATRRSGQKLTSGKPQFIVAHDTGNENTTAQANVTYYQNTYNEPWDSVASAHIFVDDKEAIVCIPTVEKAWHVLYDAPTDNAWYGSDANDVAIGVEISYFSDKKRSKKSLDNGARVLAYLAEFWGIDYKTEMPGHQDIQADKRDPGNVLQASGLGRSTSNLDAIVKKYYKTKKSNHDVSVHANMTRSQFVTWLKSSIGHQYDFDLAYGFQCYDYANAGWQKLYPGNPLKGLNAKDISHDNAVMLNGRAKVYRNTATFLAKPGDMVLFPGTYGNGSGHVAWVLSATLNQLVLVEQNWLGGAMDANGNNGWEPATKRVHAYDPNMIFIRPNFAPTKAKAATKQAKHNLKVVSKQAKNTWNWSGTFYPGETIKVRTKPGLHGGIVRDSDWLHNKNDWVKFDRLIKQDGYWWIRFKYPTNPGAGYFYCAICKITDKKEQVRNEKYWGSIKWQKT